MESDLFLILREFDPLNFFEHFNSTLNLARFGVFSPESLDKSFGLLNLSLLSLISCLKDLPSGFFLLQIVVIVTVIEIDLLSLNLCNPINEMVEENSIV